MLYIFTMRYPNHTSLVIRREWGFDVEIHGPARLEVAAAMLNNYPMRLHIPKEQGPVVLVEAGHDEERLFRALEALQKLQSPIRRDEDFREFLKNPTLERLEGLVAVKKLLEGDRRRQNP